MAKSDLGQVTIIEETFNSLFRVQDYKLDTTSMSSHIRIFEEKMGKNQPMEAGISFKDINIIFGQFEVDVVVEYTFCISFALYT